MQPIHLQSCRKLNRENSYEEEMSIWQFKLTDYDQKNKLLKCGIHDTDSLNPTAIHKYDTNAWKSSKHFRKDAAVLPGKQLMMSMAI
jgi:hypothetical protein